MKKILVGFIMNGRAGGIDKYLLNFLNTVWDKDVQIDFLTNEIEEELKFQLSCFNSKLFSISSLRQPVRQYRQIVHLLEQGDYDTVYFNISTAIDCIAALAAKRCNVKKRIIHSHSSGNDCENWKKRKVFDFIHGICRLFLYKMGTHFYGCSKKAGLWMFPKRIVESSRFEVIYNAVDIEKFNFSSYERAKIRKDLNVEDRFVIGHVGNFCYAKNYPFLIQVFREVWKLDSRAILLLAGEGAQYEAVRQQVKDMGIADSVKFLGWCQEVQQLYQGMDVFLLPSHFEGLPVVGVEAQSMKLQCVMSDSITEESKIIDQCYFLSLKDSPEVWAEFILSHKDYDRHQVKLLDNAKNYNLQSQKQKWRQLI